MRDILSSFDADSTYSGPHEAFEEPLADAEPSRNGNEAFVEHDPALGDILSASLAKNADRDSFNGNRHVNSSLGKVSGRLASKSDTHRDSVAAYTSVRGAPPHGEHIRDTFQLESHQSEDSKSAEYSRPLAINGRSKLAIRPHSAPSNTGPSDGAEVLSSGRSGLSNGWDEEDDADISGPPAGSSVRRQTSMKSGMHAWRRGLNGSMLDVAHLGPTSPWSPAYDHTGLVREHELARIAADVAIEEVALLEKLRAAGIEGSLRQELESAMQKQMEVLDPDHQSFLFQVGTSSPSQYERESSVSGYIFAFLIGFGSILLVAVVVCFVRAFYVKRKKKLLESDINTRGLTPAEAFIEAQKERDKEAGWVDVRVETQEPQLDTYAALVKQASLVAVTPRDGAENGRLIKVGSSGRSVAVESEQGGQEPGGRHRNGHRKGSGHREKSNSKRDKDSTKRRHKHEKRLKAPDKRDSNIEAAPDEPRTSRRTSKRYEDRKEEQAQILRKALSTKRTLRLAV